MHPPPASGAEALLLSLKSSGIDYVFANAGTDFAPLIEAWTGDTGGRLPQPLTVLHETAAVGMAHGFYLLSGRPQAAMVHVNVGLANALMNLINAAGDDVPVLLMAGRTPLTEHQRPGARMTPIQYGQEMYDQSGMVRGVVKFDYELRYPEQAMTLPARALAIALGEPRGPVYLSLPREPLCEAWPPQLEYRPQRPPQQPAAVADPDAIEQAATLLAQARSPLIVAQRGDPEGRVGAALAALADDCALPVVEFSPTRNLLASDRPMLLGYAVAEPLREADVVLAVDAAVPWIERFHRPAPGKTVIHLGPDPLFRRLPLRGFQTDLAIAGDVARSLQALGTALRPRLQPRAVSARRERITARSRARLAEARRSAETGCTAPMSADWIARCVGEIMDEDAVVFNELGLSPAAMDLKGPNRYFASPHSGGLGWGLSAALGAQLADRERLVIACVGDGSYVFANPVACHQIAEAHALPVLSIVKNNGVWNAVRRATRKLYPEGRAARGNGMPLVSLEPAPDYTRIAAASRAHTERVEHGEQLPAALRRALRVIREQRRQVLLELCVAVSDES